MKKFNGKTLMVITLFFASLFATPAMVVGSTHDDGFKLDQFGDGTDIIGGFQQGFGSLFGGLGYGGHLIGRVFEILFFEGIKNFSKSQMLDGVYVLNATLEDPLKSESKTFSNKEEYYLLPLEYALPYNTFFEDEGYAYCEVVKDGTYDFNLKAGAAVTLVIWDNDGSFIEAVTKLIRFFQRIMPVLEGKETPTQQDLEDLIREGISLITWFLIHINDIFTGDELIMLNPISWQELAITPQPSFSIAKRWMVSGDDGIIGSVDDKELNEANFPGVANLILADWSDTANNSNDYSMQWTFSSESIIPAFETRWTTFTFDLIQLWVKNFHIEINVAALLEGFAGMGGTGIGAPINVADVFGGCNIEFFLFTHHLAGAFLYNDTIVPDGVVTAEYARLNYNTTDGRPVDVPYSSELTHRIVLNSVTDFQFIDPHVDKGEIKWGLNLWDALITPVPLGVELDTYLNQPQEHLDYIYFGFTFDPNPESTVTARDGTQVNVLYGAVKVDQFFAPWNDNVNPHAINNIDKLDLSIIYVSTVLHFQLNVETYGEDPEKPEFRLDPDDDYIETEDKLMIGDYLDGKVGQQLEFVDIAGPYYEVGNDTAKNQYDASTAIIPVALWYHEMERHDTFEDPSGEMYTTFATDISINVTFNVLVYAVCYPKFNDGSGVWHDPTFSIYMIFEAKGFWAIILLVAGVGLVGVATILIKRRKDARF